MAGSLKWFVYTTNSGDDFALYRDESNLEAVNAGTQDYVDATTVQYALPRNVYPRYLRFRSADGLVSRNIVALTSTIYDAVAANSSITDAVSGKTLILSEKVGERIRYPKAVDTGLTDSDAT
jgi:hypothetical protein